LYAVYKHIYKTSAVVFCHLVSPLTYLSTFPARCTDRPTTASKKVYADSPGTILTFIVRAQLCPVTDVTGTQVPARRRCVLLAGVYGQLLYRRWTLCTRAGKL